MCSSPPLFASGQPVGTGQDYSVLLSSGSGWSFRVLLSGFEYSSTSHLISRNADFISSHPVLFVELWCSALLTRDYFRVNAVTWLSLCWVWWSSSRAVVVGLMWRRVRDWVGKLGREWPGLSWVAACVLSSWSKHQLKGVILSLGESYQR